MSLRTTAAIGVSVIVMAVGANQALMPGDAQELEQQQRQNQIEQLSDSEEQANDRRRDAGNDHLNAELERKNLPGELRSPETPHIRIRIP